MKAIINRSGKSALIIGVVLIFLIIFGLTTTISEILGDLLGLPSRSMVGSTGGLMLFFGLLALWAGSRVSDLDRSSLKSSLLTGLVKGLIIGFIASAFILLIGSIDAADVDIRKYLEQLNRPNVILLLYGRNLWTGILITLVIFIVFGVAGGLLSFYLADRDVRDFIDKRYLVITESVRDIPLIESYQSSSHKRWINFGVLALGLLLIPQVLGRYWNYAMGTVGIYVLMGLGLNIVVGLAGLLDLGYVAFFAIGAYTTGLLTAPVPIPLQIGFWPVLIISIIFAAISGIILGLPVLRMRGDYLAIVTLGFGEIIRVLIRSDLMTPYLGGPNGIKDIVGPNLFGFSLISDRAYLYLIIIGIIITILLTNYLQNSRVGRAWMAMREDETVAQAMGINTLKYKLMAFATGAAFAGIGGALFAARNQYTGPGDHTLLVSINVLCLIIVGGMGSIPGVIVGAFVLKGLPEILRELEIYRMLIFGALLVIMMIVRPEGLWPAPRRRLELHEDEPDFIPPDKAVVGEGG